MKKISIGLYLFLIASTVLKAQSYHFSQFFSTPLLTNPGHTGFIDGPYRVASNFRMLALSKNIYLPVIKLAWACML
jgi:hypothetical protein